MAELKLNDGGILAYDDVGSGPTIVLLHGWSLNRDVFDLQRAALCDRFRIVVPDLRGHGSSTPIGNGTGLPALANDIAELLRELQLSNVVLVGWSMGAMIAWDVATGPEANRIIGLVSIDMVPQMLNDDNWQYGFRGRDQHYDIDIDVCKMRTDWPAYAEAFVPKIFARGKDRERQSLVNKMLTLSERDDVNSVAKLWVAMTEENYRARVTRLEIPSLIVYGALSQFYEEQASIWMEANIPYSKRVRFEESGHAPHLEEPGEFNTMLAQFATGLFNSTTKRVN